MLFLPTRVIPLALSAAEGNPVARSPAVSGLTRQPRTGVRDMLFSLIFHDENLTVGSRFDAATHVEVVHREPDHVKLRNQQNGPHAQRKNRPQEPSLAKGIL